MLKGISSHAALTRAVEFISLPRSVRLLRSIRARCDVVKLTAGVVRRIIVLITCLFLIKKVEKKNVVSTHGNVVTLFFFVPSSKKSRNKDWLMFTSNEDMILFLCERVLLKDALIVDRLRKHVAHLILRGVLERSLNELVPKLASRKPAIASVRYSSELLEFVLVLFLHPSEWIAGRWRKAKRNVPLGRVVVPQICSIAPRLHRHKWRWRRWKEASLYVELLTECLTDL